MGALWQKINRIKQCKIFELQSGLFSMNGFFATVFQAPNRTIIVPLGAKIDIAEVFLHTITSK